MPFPLDQRKKKKNNKKNTLKQKKILRKSCSTKSKMICKGTYLTNGLKKSIKNWGDFDFIVS